MPVHIDEFLAAGKARRYMSSNNIIELNGSRYDATTGKFIGKAAPPVAAAVKRGAAIDGFVAPAKSKPHHRPTATDATTALKSTRRPAAHHPIKKLHHVSHKPHSVTAHQPEHSKTLMRHAVKPPTIKPQKALKMQGPTDVIKAKHKPAVLGVKPKLSSEQVDPARSARASGTHRSQLVRRFSDLTYAPRPTLAQPSQPAASARTTTQHPPMERPRPAALTKHDIFDQALARATSHEQPAPKESPYQRAKRNGRRHSRAAGISAAVLAVLLLGGFFAYQNKADLELQLASAKAGFQASLPSYKPSGYAVKGLHYSPGTVTIGYLSGGKSYNVTQKASNWDSETLLQNYVADANQPYEAYQAAGRTVYIYGNGNATWVNGGIWYQVNSNGNLDKNQIINLATSM